MKLPIFSKPRPTGRGFDFFIHQSAIFGGINEQVRVAIKACKLLVFILLATPVLASGDSVNVKEPPIRYFAESQFEFLPNRYFVPDTTLALFHYGNSDRLDFSQYLGNILTATRPLVFKIEDDIGFRQGITAFDRYLTSPTEVKYFNNRKPYTKLSYVFGSKDEQAINVVHSQNVSKQFNAGVNLKLISAQGFYARQKSGLTRVTIHDSYQSRSNRYGLKSNLLYEKIEVEENGGLTDTALSERDSTFLRDALEVNLGNARNQITRYSFYLKQHVNFGLVSTLLDTIDSTIKVTVHPTSRLTHGFHYSGNAFSFNNPGDTTVNNSTDSSYYAGFFTYDPVTDILDSIYYERFENEISFSTLAQRRVGDSLGRRKVMYSTWLKHQLVEYDQHLIDTALHNYMIGAAMKAEFTKSLHFIAKGSYVMAGYNGGDYQVVPKVYISPQDSRSAVSFWLKIKEKQPDFSQQNYSSPHISWSNNFGKINYQQAGFSYNNNKYGINVTAVANRINGFIYSDAFAVPQQLDETLEIYRLSVNKVFNMGKWHATIKGVYQGIKGKNVLRLPMLCGFGEMYYENYIFKRAMLARIGFDVWYSSDYGGDSWMPLTRQYYLQNYQKVSNYPFADIFLAFKIKSAKVFVKWRHINAGLVNYRYFTTPRHPLPDNISSTLGINTTLRLGIDWTFLN